MISSHIINRMRDEASVDYIWYFFHEISTHNIEKDIEAKSIYNIDEEGFGQKSSTKKVIYVQG